MKKMRLGTNKSKGILRQNFVPHKFNSNRQNNKKPRVIIYCCYIYCYK